MDHKKWLDKTYSAKNVDDLAEAYDGWAESYDSENYFYIPPIIITGLICRYLKTSDLILDAGVGTGMLGKLLMTLDYKNLFGIDLSEGMLNIARKREVYKELRKMVLGNRLEFENDMFDAVISVGTFTENNAPADSFDELVRIVRPDGFVIFSTRVDIDLGFQVKQDEIEQSGRWKLVEKTNLFQATPFAYPEVLITEFVYKVL